MIKRMLAGLMALILVLSLLPAGVVAEEVSLEKTTAHTNHSSWTAWENGSELPTAEGNYYLTTDVALTTTARIITAQAVTICLSDHKIQGPSSGGGIFRLENGAVVTICDCTAHTDENGNYVAGQLLPRCSVAGGIASLGGNTGATFVLQDGIIDGAGRSYSNDGAVVVVNKGGTFRMEGGQIKNFAITNCGIVRVWQGSFYLSGGKLFDNSSTGTVDGVVVRVDNGSAMYMSGGEIINNTSKTAAGAAVNVASGGTLELSGGTIARNSAPNGAAIIVNGTLRMTGGAICDNTGTANGAGMYINPNGTAIISGGSISHNTAPNGAGIYCSGKLTVSGDTVISENIATGKGGGLCAENAATVTLSGGSFTKNNAATGGGVYYGSTGTMTLGGSTVITGNTAENAKSNLYLADGKCFRLDGTALPLTQGAAVGISLSKVPASTVVLATGAPQADAAEYFTMDAPVEGFELRCGSSLRYGKARQLQHPVEGYDKAGHPEGWSEWSDLTTLPKASGKYYLVGDVVLTGETNLDADVDITLCLNGYNILAASGKRAFKLSGNAKLTLCDCTSHYDKDGSFVTGSVSGGAGTALVEGGTLTIYDILMTGGVGSQAGALQITGGKVEIYGSELSGNRCTAGSGGGAICITGGSLLLQDTRIAGNFAAEAGASAIFSSGNVVLTLRDSVITNNTHTSSSVTWRGAVYILNGMVKCTVSGSTVIDDNYLANGKTEGNLFFQNADARVTVDNLTKGARIGVLTQTAVTESKSLVFSENVKQADAAGYFTSDRGHAVTLQEGCLVVGVHKHVNHTTDQCGHENAVWQAWNGQLTTPGHYYLTQNLTLSEPLKFQTEGEFALCLNGYNIMPAAGKRAFQLSGGAALTLCDCTARHEDGKLVAGMVSGGAGTAQVENATLAIYNCNLTGGVDAQAGALLINNGAKVAVYDSEIFGNRCTGGAGGGAICITGGSLLLQNTRITSNFADDAGGSAIFSNGQTILTIKDSEIANNMHTSSSTTWRGAVYILKGTVECTISGSTVIDDNYLANGKLEGNLFFQNADARVIVDQLTEGARIGVLTQTAVTDLKPIIFAENVVQADAATYFTSDRGYIVTLEDGNLTVGMQKHEAHATDECSHENVTWRAWNGQLTTPGHYYLTQDLILTKHLEFNTEGEFTLCLNGYNVYCPQGDRAFKLLGGAKLNLCDCSAHSDADGNYIAGQITGGSTPEGAAIFIYHKDSRFTLYDGLITGNTSQGDRSKGVVLVVDGQFVMAGGEISGNTSQHGMVWLNGQASDFRMEAGQITRNTIESIDSGALHMHQGTATMTGGEISCHNAKGVYMNLDSRFTLAGGKITKNNSQRDGAGVRVDTPKAVFTMTGGEISENVATGGAGGIMTKGIVKISGGVIRGNQAVNGAGLVAGSGSVVEISGGSLEANYAKDSGAGLYVQADAKVTISGGTICRNATGNNAAGVCMTGGTLEMTGGSIKGNTAPNTGAGVYVFSKGVFTLKDGQICENISDHEGAGVYVNDGTLEMLGGQICGNSTATSGGGVCVRGENGKFILRGGAVKENRALTEKLGNAAGILVQGKGTLLMYGGEVTGNSAAVDGGGIQNYFSTAHLYGGTISNNTVGNEGGGVHCAGGQLTLEGANVTGNQAKAAAGVQVTQKSTVKMTGGKISNNSAKNDGGGLVVQGKSTFTMTGGQIDGNTASKTGAGVYVAKDSTFYLQSGSVSNNVAQGEGAGVYINSGKLVMTGGAISGNITNESGAGIVVRGEGGSFQLKDGSVSGNQAMNPEKGHGGGVLIQSGGKMEMSGGKVNKNQVAGNGAGIYNSGTPLVITGGSICENSTVGEGAGMYLNGGTTTLDGGSVENNETTKGNGGGICARGGAQLIMKSGKVAGNKSAAHAGGILLQSNAKLVMNGGEVTGNSAAVDGGGIQNYFSTAHLYGGTISNNTVSNEGGGVHCAGGQLTLEGANVTGNQAKAAAGVQVTQKSTVKMTGGKISNNSAKNDGGGLVVQGKSTFTMTGGEISGNTVPKTGAGVYVAKDSTFLLQRGSISNNIAQGEGAGAYINGGKLIMTGGTIAGNVTDSSGAGVCVRGEGASLELRGGEICANKATNPEKGHGGGVLVQSGGAMTMTGGKIAKNQVAGNGAGIYNSKAPLVITGGCVCENSSVGEGAGIYSNVGTVTLDGGSVENNETTKGNGGGICARGGAQLTINSGKVAGNKSAAHAGGILLQSNAKLIMNGGEITENTAVISGGGIRSAGCEIEIYGGKITKNISGELGGGIYAEKSLIVKNCEISENQIVTANGGAGAGIRLGTGAVAHLENVVFHANSAIGRGGAFDTAYSCTSTLVNCTFTENFTTSNGAAIDSGIVGTMTLKNCVFRDNKTDGYGGAFYGEANGKYLFEDCVLENNSAVMGGAIYVKASGRTDLVNTKITGNSASIMASAIYSNSGIFLTDCTITGNTDAGNSCAVYLTNEGTDHESYVPCANQLRGTVQIADNQGGDLVLGEYTAVNVHGDGLGEQSKILLQLPQGGIQRFVTGPYDYSREADIYTITAGTRSLTETDPVTEPEQNTEQPTEPEQPQEKENSGVAVIAAVAAGVLLVLAAVVLLIVRKSKKH